MEAPLYHPVPRLPSPALLSPLVCSLSLFMHRTKPTDILSAWIEPVHPASDTKYWWLRAVGTATRACWFPWPCISAFSNSWPGVSCLLQIDQDIWGPSTLTRYYTWSINILCQHNICCVNRYRAKFQLLAQILPWNDTALFGQYQESLVKHLVEQLGAH